VKGAASFFPFNSLNIMRYGSSCRAIMMLISTEGSDWYCICIYWATPRICETAQYESAKSERCVCVCYETRAACCKYTAWT